MLLGLLQAALARVDGRRCVREALSGTRPAAARALWVAAVGKGACAMALGAHDALGAAIERTLVITRDAQLFPELSSLGTVETLLGGHPVPDERSLAAGERLLRWVDQLPAAVEPLFLVSGGASSLIEVLRAGATLDKLVQLNRRGLSAGMPIAELNAERAELSCIKGGRLAARLRGRPGRAFFLSDVPDDDPRVIGSGLMGPADEGTDRIERQVLASVDDAVAAVAAAGAAQGLSVQAPGERFAGSATRLASRFVHELHITPAQLCVWGGESTVRLPEHPGRGGRNQHLALAMARLIAGDPALMLLAVGTDGTDGLTEDAGALVDGETCARIALAQLDAGRCLAEADSARALDASGDLIHTGPTGTNVGDLVVGLKLSTAVAQALAARHDEARSRVL